jgi:GH35 family endo-1,4-beta-xylanase
MIEVNVEWARRHDITVKGHPLAWNYFGQPSWMDDAGPEEALEMQLDRIEEMASHFRGKVDMWDVVNEAAGWDRDPTSRNCPELTAAIKKVGIKEFVRRAYRRARKGNPDATLLTNDYVLGEKYHERGIRPLIVDGQKLFDVIGIQSHMHGGVWPVEKIWSACEGFADYGVPLHFTEVTITSGDPEDRRERDKWETTPEGEERQAEQVERFYRVLFSHPSVEAIVWWNLTDRHAWLGAPAGLIRKDMSPKPAYDRLWHLVKEEWWTHLRKRADESGQVRFRGFYGDYRVIAALPSGKTASADFTLTEDGPGELDLKLR